MFSRLGLLIEAIREAIELRRARNIRRAIAEQFNKTNVVEDARLSLWMCGDCGRIHPAFEGHPLDLPSFPACCSTERGPRLARKYATGLPQS